MEDATPHILKVSRWVEETDQGTQEEVDFEIIHLPDCKHHVEHWETGLDFLPDVEMEVWECNVGIELDNCGLDSLAFYVKEGPERWQDLPAGEYTIKFWGETYTHYEYGPEYDCGLCFDPSLEKQLADA